MTTRIRVLLTLVAVILGLGTWLVFAGGVFAVWVYSHHTIALQGTYTVKNETCQSVTTDYPDITQGTVVKITDQTGQQVAAASLSGCLSSTGGCFYEFGTEVPAADSYGITIGENRGTVQFSRDDVENDSIEVSIG